MKGSKLLKLLLGSELVGVTTLLLAAVDSTRMKTGIALTADLLVAVVLAGQLLEGRLDDTTAKTEDKVEGRLLLDVVVSQSAAENEMVG